MALAYLYQPAPAQVTGKLYAAYRPIVVQVLDDLAPFAVPAAIPVVYLDVYINGTYYKSLSATSPVTQAFGTFPFPVVNKRVWTFDLQDTMQEYLRSEPAALSGTTLDPAPAAICSFYTKLRGSSINTNGFTVPDGPAPVQGNFDTAPTAGGGTQSATWYAVNATLQHEDAQDLVTHLGLYKHPLATSSAINALPLSHRPTDGGYLCCKNQYDHFPVLFPYNSINGGNAGTSLILTMDWKERGGGSFFRTIGTFAFPAAPGIVNIPVGLAQIMALFPSGTPTPDLNKLTSYFLYLRPSPTAPIVWATGWITVAGCCSDGARLHFLNASGGFDTVSFNERTESLITKSGTYQRSLPLLGLKRRDYGHQRFNVTSNERVLLRSDLYGEQHQAWLKELLDSPRVYLETKSQGDELPDLIPVVILDGEFITRKTDERYQYTLELTYAPANENIRQRG